jgi:copper ion binding protein
MAESTYVVEGMTCAHCVKSVTEEISEIAGVQGVDVDLGSGKVVVTSTAPIEVGQVRDAVTEAGYQLAA